LQKFESMQRRKRIIFILSHPIQYFSPLFQLMAKDPEINLLVLYCSDENIKGHIDKDFGIEVKWDIPLLEGYNYKFLKNNSWKPSIFKGFFGLINLEIFRALKNERDSLLIVHGWSYATNFLAILAAKINGLILCLRAENPLNQELLKPKSILFLRKFFFRFFFFKLFNFFLYIGKQNKQLYEYYGVKQNKLIFTPYAVDNDRYRKEYELYHDKKFVLREELGLPVDKKIILFSGKYIRKKRPLDLLLAYQKLNDPNSALVFLGEGKLRNEMQNFISENKLMNVYLTGFKNQSEVGKYFAAADLFVLPSGIGETWGLVVNEALNFNLPVIVSNIVGCADDLAMQEQRFTFGDINDLKYHLLINLNRSANNTKAFTIIDNYSNTKIIESLKSL
jgi:glycosyltransferase involved in cell wall biosynthesis